MKDAAMKPGAMSTGKTKAAESPPRGKGDLAAANEHLAHHHSEVRAPLDRKNLPGAHGGKE